MTEFLKESMNIINKIHDLILYSVERLGFNITDKQLHFIIIAALGIILFAFVHLAFRYISKYSITAISFIYTFTLLVVIVLGIEIGQKLSNGGNMEFADIVFGLWGFICIFIVYICIRVSVKIIKKHFKSKEGIKDESID